PPYFSGGPASRNTPTARREDLCGPRELMSAASFSLKFGGDFFLVHRPERLAELIAAGVECALEPKRLRLVRHRQDGPVSLILLQFRKGAKPGLNWEEVSLHYNIF
ncbi:MAG: methyltransferase, partial [Akkermansia sp.]